MKFPQVLATAVLSLVCLSSQAGVIYEWKPLDKEAPYGFSLRLEIDRAAVRSGALSFMVAPQGEPETYPDSGLLSLRYRAGGGFIDYSPRSGYLDQWGYGKLSLELHFERGFATGYLYANDTNSHVEIASIGRLFTVLDANSDAGMEGAGCDGYDTPCSGATGQLREIPEPQPLALLGLGGLMAFAARRIGKRRAGVRPA